MLSKKIVDGCEFIVFDLEWNQPIPGKTYDFDCATLTGEIIEIGACRYIYENGDLICKGTFSADIVPAVYTRLPPQSSMERLRKFLRMKRLLSILTALML